MSRDGKDLMDTIRDTAKAIDNGDEYLNSKSILTVVTATLLNFI